MYEFNPLKLSLSIFSCVIQQRLRDEDEFEPDSDFQYVYVPVVVRLSLF